MQNMRLVPIEKLEELEADRLALYDFLKTRFNMEFKDYVILERLTSNTWTLAHRKDWIK